MTTTHRVLVTGSAGRIGHAVVKELTDRRHIVVGFDVKQTPDLPPPWSVVAPLSDVDALRQAAKEATCLIHLAATPDDAEFPDQDPPDNFLSELVPNNIVALYHVMEAARNCRIPRVILASSVQVVEKHVLMNQVPVTPDSPLVPRHLYACTKVFLEALGGVYARNHELQVLAVRLGWCPREGQAHQIAEEPIFQDMYLSPGDAGRFFAATVEAEKVPSFAVVYATSRHKHQQRYDLTATHQLLGWKPRDQWPDGSN